MEMINEYTHYQIMKTETELRNGDNAAGSRNRRAWRRLLPLPKRLITSLITLLLH